MNASGTKLQLVVNASIALLEIDPEGWSRSHSEIPWRMLSVPSVAMIDGRRKTRTSSALKAPTAKPDADQRERARDQPPGRGRRRHRVRGDDDAERHQGADRDVEAADEQRAGLAHRDERERHRREQQVAQVVARQEGVLPDRRVRADREDQRRHQDERHDPAEPDPGDRSRHARPEGHEPASRRRPRVRRRSPRRSGARRGPRRGSRRRSSRATSRPPGRRARRARAGRST